MAEITATGTHTCICRCKVTYKFLFNGYAEWVQFFVGNKGVRDCPECGKRLVYRD